MDGWRDGGREGGKERGREGKSEFQPCRLAGKFRTTTFQGFRAGLITSRDSSSSDFFQPSIVMSRMKGTGNKQLQVAFVCY